MKVAHLAVVTPGRCGLYETTRELVAGLRKRGVHSCIVDPTAATNKLHPGGMEDRGAHFADMEWALTADVVVSHSGIGPQLEATEQPLVHVAHGRPRSSFLHEMSGGTKIYSHLRAQNSKDRCKAVVSFWPEHEPYLRVMFPDKEVHTVQACVDLEAWAPGPTDYDFDGKADIVNVVCADMWRHDNDPFVALNAYALFARETPNAKLHLYGLTDTKGPVALIRRVQEDGTMGTIHGHTKQLLDVYRAATCAVTTQSIDTRSVREAMATGCPVVRISGPNLNGYRAAFWDGLTRSRVEIRKEAERRFDPDVTAEQFERVLAGVLAQ